MANIRSGVPAGWTWRDGRPRWIPSPALRLAGWKGLDLKDQHGRWLGRGPSIDRADTIAAAVAAWRGGHPVPAALGACAPPGADTVGRAPAPALDRFAIGRLVDAYVASPELGRRAAKTSRDYRNKLKRLVDTLAGYAVLPPRGDAEAAKIYAARIAEIRALSVLTLEPVETAAAIADPLHAAYWALHKAAGVHQASGVLVVASAWLTWCHQRESRTIHNWAKGVQRETPPGRLRVGTWAEIKALIDAADSLGLHSMADAIVLGVDLGWSQVDRLALTWPRLRRGRAMTGTEGRIKTGRVGGTPLTSLGRARVARILVRHRAMAAHPTHVLWCERTGAPWKPDHYRHVFADEVRALAALKVPSVIDFTDADLRDTAFTWGRNAGLDDDGTASRSLQSRRNVKTLGDKHYGEIGPEIADRAAAQYDRWLIAQGVAL